MTDSSPTILVVDDETQIRRLLRITLEGAGYRVIEAENGKMGLTQAATGSPDCVVLDMKMPDLMGVEVLRRIREWSSMPVLMLSVQGREADKIEALDAGADDYLTKPFGSGELLARLRVLLRRARSPEEESIATVGALQVDFANRIVRKAGEEVHLTVKEYALLKALILHRGRVVTHRQLLRDIWGPNHEEDTHYLRVHITHLRKKIGDGEAGAEYIRTEPGVGYRFAEE
jgi:two-component system KDP operon response regulator KdpE